MRAPWAAVLDVEDGDLRVRFARPVREVTLTPACARTFAAALLVTAEEAEQDDPLDPSDPQRMTIADWTE